MNVRYLILYITWMLFPLGLQAQMAPDFTISDKEENEVSLSALRGKYVLLDLMIIMTIKNRQDYFWLPIVIIIYMNVK